MKDHVSQTEVRLYLESARESLEVAELNFNNDFYSAAVNRAYYAVFYSANALLSTRKLARSKHSGVLAAFRQHFIKTGLIEPEMSDIYGRIMEDRHASDYELIGVLSQEDAREDLSGARIFVERMEAWLRKEGWL